MDEIRVLQLGEEDWNRRYELPETMELSHVRVFTEAPGKPYDMVFLDRTPSDGEIGALYRASKAYALFVTDRVEIGGRTAWLLECRKGKHIASGEIQDFLLREAGYYYPKPYGEKFGSNNLTISRNFSGDVSWNGNHDVALLGDFGEDFRQIAYWRNNVPIRDGRAIDLWLEYRKDESVDILLEATRFAADGSIDHVLERVEYSEADLEDVVRIEGKNSFVFFALYAKGRGELRIVALHDRHSRGRHGYFLPGGERHVTSEREEVFSYFDPADRKPPLNVFFSGWEMRQGFQGYNMNRDMGCPFLLLSEQRLQGGSFYIGSEEYEGLVADIIRRHMAELGFGPEQVILSGLSMGAYGALYHGCDIRPHALLLMKPLANLGNVAANERLRRPKGFPASLDVLNYLSGDTDETAVRRLNRRFWDRFDAADWGRSKFIVSYMIEDDFEADAYGDLISHLHSSGVQVYGKGIHGRHNDNTRAIVNWFSSQFEKILFEDFGRGAVR